MKTKTSRRKFLKKASAAAAAFTIVPRHVLGGSSFVAPSEKLVVAGIAAGRRGAGDLHNCYKSGKVEIGYLCDVDEAEVALGAKGSPDPEHYKKAKYYADFREMLDKEQRHIDAVCIATPDHNHAIQALAAMQLGKHVYVEKPMTHDIWEARVLTDAAKRYKVVTQMGNQGASDDGPRLAREWYEAGAIGDVHTVYVWTDRPVWPAGIHWSSPNATMPKDLDYVPNYHIPKEKNWDLWLGTAPYRDFVDRFNWRCWWDYGTGSIGDMGCHLMELPFSVLGLQEVQEVHASAGTVYKDHFRRDEFFDSVPPSSYATLRFAKTSRTQGPVTLYWMDGGITPPIPDELGPDEPLGSNGALLVGTKGKILAGVYGRNPRLLPTSRQVKVPQKYPRVPLASGNVWGPGHAAQWVEACLAGYGKKELSSSFDIAGPLTEAALLGNLAIRTANMKMEGRGFGRDFKLQWDSKNMRVTNFDLANQFVKREYRPGWEVKYKL
ncbi:oxidoreductase [Cephaloticoccus primus]|uniref:Oxidoreductase n=1 Tax=Cephaloticoccus primus TaxID=1548207 RepID=A0A139SN03_9BACT|nr:Gfo/Idh/MocA family oxidoreductase [Cephaloticoccus primus]KXU35891.1 oxidoreductase [Cephaloticoccus primus]